MLVDLYSCHPDRSDSIDIMIQSFVYSVGRALRETGQALDRVGLRVLEKPIFMEPCARACAWVA